MKITGIKVWQVDLPLVEGRYSWSDGRYVELFDTTIVELETDSGLKGYGECCPLGPSYLPSYANGVRAGIAELAPHLIGEDPCNLNRINHTMDAVLKGHPYAKTPLDMACWDIAGKSAGLPVCDLFGGRMQEGIVLYRAISQGSPEAMADSVSEYRDQGYRMFQLKVGGDPDEDIERIRNARMTIPAGETLVADANTGWTKHEAARVVGAVADTDVYIEQPCLTYSECLSVRRRTPKPFILDEVIDNIEVLIRGISDDAMDIINLKVSKVGGLTKARVIRDICVASGIPMTIEDAWGGDFTTAAIAHLAQSTPEEFCFSSTDFNSYVTVSTAEGAPKREDGRMSTSSVPGLGCEPREFVLRAPALLFGR